MKKNFFISLIIIICLAAFAASFLRLHEINSQTIPDAGKAVSKEEKTASLSYGQDSFTIKDRLDTLLFIGTDSDRSYADLRKDMEGGYPSFYNHIQSDVLVLFVFDNDRKSVTPIQINRDTMFDVPWTDVLGRYGGTTKKQLALSYNSGSGLEDSCENTRLTVSSLLFGAPVDHYVAFTMNGINALNDLVGGVVVDIVDDLTPADPALVKGTTVRLMGSQAESFLRSRMLLTDDTNLARMRRHRDYYAGFIVSAKAMMEKDEDFALEAFSKLDPYTLTDMTVQKFSELITKLDTYDVQPIQYAEGELRIGQFYEFYPDMDQLWGIVRSIFRSDTV